MSIRATDTFPKPGLHFLGCCYRFVAVEWPHLNRDDTPDQGFERQFRAFCFNRLGGDWKVSYPRELQLGSGLDTASGIGHVGIEELLKNRQLLHPRVLLTTASKVVAYAVDGKHNQIDAVVVAKALENTATLIPTPDVTEGIEGAI